MTGDVMLASALAIAGLMLATWVVGLALRDVSIVDIVWGLGFVLVAWVALAVGDGSHDRRLLLAVLVTAWGLRLAGYLARRNLGKGEDYRYAAMRRHYGGRFPLVSLYLVFGLQAVLMWTVSLPLQASAGEPTPAGLELADWIGVAVWATGLAFEAIGDAQLARFKADPASAGAVMDRGLWRYTRHPNYFGDFLVWWGIGVIALGTGEAWWSLAGPLVMSVLLIRVSGKGLLEKTIGRRRPGYEDYVRRTSGFVPLPPKRG
jgi:steroid 5-alpha reductase family enzyme